MRAKVEGTLVTPSLHLQAICHGEPKPSNLQLCNCPNNMGSRIMRFSYNTSNTRTRIYLLIHAYRAITASVVTSTGLWYLLPPQIERWNRPKGSGHGGHGHGEHGEESEGGEEEDSGEKGGNEGAQSEDESEGGDESEQLDDSGSEGGGNDTPDTSDDEEKVVDSGEDVEGVQFKGPSNAGPNKQQSDTRKHIPDAKGGAKKRIDSHYGQKQGLAKDSKQDPKDKDLVFSKIYLQTTMDAIV